MPPAEYIVGGYFFIAEGEAPSELLPASFLSPTDCICRIVPGDAGLPWIASPPSSTDLRTFLQLSESDLLDLQRWLEARTEENDYGWPSVFLREDLAAEFRQRYLQARNDVHLISVAFAAVDLEDAVRDFESQGIEDCGVARKLVEGEALDPTRGQPRGFDILGIEFNGGFHSFPCNGLESDFVEVLGISLNEFGLIDSRDDADRAAKYTNEESTGAEPVPWFPCRITKLR
ncbi:MAG: hypothetical protein AAF517_19700 [Planctomycetota bacterium]